MNVHAVLRGTPVHGLVCSLSIDNVFFLFSVFGEIKDASFQFLDLVWDRPTRAQAGLQMLVDPIKFTMRMESHPAEAQRLL